MPWATCQGEEQSTASWALSSVVVQHCWKHVSQFLGFQRGHELSARSQQGFLPPGVLHLIACGMIGDDLTHEKWTVATFFARHYESHNVVYVLVNIIKVTLSITESFPEGTIVIILFRKSSSI